MKAMSISESSFFARISEPIIGGSYMTVLVTIVDFGRKWPDTFLLWLVDYITWKQCVIDDVFSNSSIVNNKCVNNEDKEACLHANGTCRTTIDGFYIESALGVIYGIIFYQIGTRLVNYLEKLPAPEWHVMAKCDQKLLKQIEMKTNDFSPE
jgi:PAT family acetyl-CoA transporter-like MFS transporter 1